MKILVADDEDLARKRVVKLLNEIKLDKQIFESSSGKSTIKAIHEANPDIVFLDIQMTDMTGFDVLKEIKSDFQPIVIFVTAFDNFAVKAFEVQALDFLLKPYKKQRFLESFDRALTQLATEDRSEFNFKLSNLLGYIDNDFFSESKKSYLEKLVLKTKNTYYFVNVSDIKYIESSGYYAEIFSTDGKKHIYRISMTDFCNKLNPDMFIRINRSSIINISMIAQVISEGAGDFSVVMHDKKVFI